MPREPTGPASYGQVLWCFASSQGILEPLRPSAAPAPFVASVVAKPDIGSTSPAHFARTRANADMKAEVRRGEAVVADCLFDAPDDPSDFFPPGIFGLLLESRNSG